MPRKIERNVKGDVVCTAFLFILLASSRGVCGPDRVKHVPVPVPVPILPKTVVPCMENAGLLV